MLLQSKNNRRQNNKMKESGVPEDCDHPFLIEYPHKNPDKKDVRDKKICASCGKVYYRGQINNHKLKDFQ